MPGGSLDGVQYVPMPGPPGPPGPKGEPGDIRGMHVRGLKDVPRANDNFAIKANLIIEIQAPPIDAHICRYICMTMCRYKVVMLSINGVSD